MRNFIKIITENSREIFYHLTASYNIQSIMKNGLIPQQGLRSVQAEEQIQAVYLFPTLIDVENALMQWYEDEEHNIALLQVSIPPDIQIRKNTDWEFLTTDVIPPSNIKILSTDVMAETNLPDLLL